VDKPTSFTRERLVSDLHLDKYSVDLAHEICQFSLSAKTCSSVTV
jgi:hypothetical protein